MGRWFRYYDEALDDPKVQMLPADLFKVWINILCLSSRSGGTLPGLSAVAFALRLDGEEEAASALQALLERGLLDKDGETFHPHNWDARQFKSDISTERVKQHRKRFMKRDGNGWKPLQATPPDTDTDTDTDTDSKKKDFGDGFRALSDSLAPVIKEARK